MIAISCPHETGHKHGKDRQGNQRYKCSVCGKTFVLAAPKPLGLTRTSMKDAALALSLLLEGMSIRSVQRLTGLCRQTLADLILKIGANCERFLERTIKGLPVKDVQLDEIWSFVAMKEKSRMAGQRSMEFGDSWTFVAIERETKLVLAYHAGMRNNDHCILALTKLSKATSGRFQLTTDGLRGYSLGATR